VQECRKLESDRFGACMSTLMLGLLQGYPALYGDSHRHGHGLDPRASTPRRGVRQAGARQGMRADRQPGAPGIPEASKSAGVPRARSNHLNTAPQPANLTASRCRAACTPSDSASRVCLPLTGLHVHGCCRTSRVRTPPLGILGRQRRDAH